jgi:predicted CXXCH cytochrome family protein
MKRPRILYRLGLMLLLTIIACSVVTAGEAEQAATPGVPEIKMTCATCHGSHNTNVPEPLLVKPLSALCLDCHQDRKAPNEHVVDVVPKTKVQGLPLKDGKMTCVTCHDPHKNVHGKMLRLPRKDLCLRCHPY